MVTERMRFFDMSIVGSTADEALDFITNVLESSTEYSIIGKSLEGRVVLWNEGARRIYGYEPEEIIGQPAEVLHAPEDLVNRLPARMREEALREGRWEGVVHRMRKNGERFRGRVVMTPRHDRQGRPIGFLVVSKDITDEEIVQELDRARADLEVRTDELERANRAKDLFLASMSHELRTPLNAVIGYVGTLLMRLPGPLTEDQEKQLRVVRESAQHLLALINDVLDIARIASGRREIVLEPLPLREVVREVVDTLEPAARAQENVLEVHVPENLQVTADRRALRQILINLVDNANKFTGKGRVKVEAERNRHPVVAIRITDTGVGIPADRIASLFEPFVRLEDRLQGAPGTGLGLFLSRRLAEAMGGRIEVESEEGRGSTFTLFVPE